MIIAKMKSGALSWHIATRYEGDFRLVCNRTKVVVPKVMGDWSPRVLICENCKAALDKLDLSWRMMIAKDQAANVSKIGLRNSQVKIDFAQVVDDLIKTRRGSQ